jgi:hypothetical protein
MAVAAFPGNEKLRPMMLELQMIGGDRHLVGPIDEEAAHALSLLHRRGESGHLFAIDDDAGDKAFLTIRWAAVAAIVFTQVRADEPAQA